MHFFVNNLQKASVLATTIERDTVIIDRLKRDVVQELKNAEMASRTLARLKTPIPMNMQHETTTALE